MGNTKISVIWNVTNRCPWDCAFCCMDAGPHSRRPEMTLTQKLQAADELRKINCRVDLSGGEVMLNKADHLILLDRLANNIGKENLGLSCSGAGIDDDTARRISTLVSEVEMTMDANPDRTFCFRPTKYHKTAAQAVRFLTKYGVRVGMQTVVTQAHKTGVLEDLYSWLCEAGINNWSILKFFPSGRGRDFPYLELTDSECLNIVNRIKALDAGNTSTRKPKLDIHYQMPGTEKSGQCRCVKKSVGILPDGRVTACFWGLDAEGRLLDDRFLLGDLTRQGIEEVLASPNAMYWKSYCGECQIGIKEMEGAA